MVEMCTHLATERAGLVTLHLSLRALEIYPDVPSIARFGRLAYLMHAKVTTYVLLRCKRHGRPERRMMLSGGNDLGGKQTRRPED